MTGLADALLATPEGIAFLACGASVGRLADVLVDPGLTLCLAAHALGEVARGTDGGRIASFVDEPGEWLRDAAVTVEQADTGWWSDEARGRVLRCVEDDLAGVELLDGRGRRRSAAEEASAHLPSDTAGVRVPPRRCHLADGTRLLVVDRPTDVDDEVRAALDDRGPGRPAVQLTLRGALTVPRSSLRRWPWPVAGVRLSAEPALRPAAPVGAEPATVHDYDWPSIGRPVDPRLDHAGGGGPARSR